MRDIQRRNLNNILFRVDFVIVNSIINEVYLFNIYHIFNDDKRKELIRSKCSRYIICIYPNNL